MIWQFRLRARNDYQMIQCRIFGALSRRPAHLQKVSRRAARFSRRLFSQQRYRRALKNMRRPNPRCLRRR
jgi:hypothetical protein